MSEPGDVIQLDSFTVMMFKHMKEVMDAEPELPNGNEPRYLSEELSAQHYEWSRQRDAMRILIGVQLVNLGLEQL